MDETLKADHIMSFTYEPKIDPVWDEEILQTIRKRRPGAKRKEEGDIILFHTWEGKPYRSKWGRRKYVEVSEVDVVSLMDSGLTRTFPGEMGYLITSGVTPWDSDPMDELAALDGIAPPTGKEMRRLMPILNGPDWEGFYDIIRWEVL